MLLVRLILFSTLGGILYVTASGVVISDWVNNRMSRTALLPSKQYQDMSISAAVLGIFAAVLMFVETGYYLVSDEDEDSDDDA